jgi:predicted Rdx family selenoprotein
LAEIKLVPGTPGQFDVLMDGERIATRSKGWQRFFGGGWPSAQDVATAARGNRA